MQVRIEYTYDSESHNWSYRVPSLGIVGGSETREDAEREVIEAIAFALEDDPEVAEPIEGEIRYLELSVQR
jgi:predicted RNase H-like HicB family nuclease